MLPAEDIALIVVGLWLLGFKLEVKPCKTNGCRCVVNGDQAAGGAAGAAGASREMTLLEAKAGMRAEPSSSQLVNYEMGMSVGQFVSSVQGAAGGY